MTERSHGAPDPAEPSTSGAAPVPGSPAPGADLGAVRRTDALFDELAARRIAAFEAVSPSSAPGDRASGDPAVRLLHALVADVDAGLGIGPATGPDALPGKAADQATDEEAEAQAQAQADQAAAGTRRRGSRTFVALGVVGVVLAGTGVAAAGGESAGHAAPAPKTPKVSEEPHADRLTPKSRQTAPDGPPATTPGTRPGVPVQVRPAGKGPDPDPVRKQIEDIKGKLEDLLPPRPRRQNPGDWPFREPKADDGDDTRRKLDDIRRQAQKRLDRYRDRRDR
ncbi:hypothetical protein ACGFNU_26180 [Spirillospora sp. NPDC048911]|uniref:hypothetical protein n=1 Tax=Spirillospora sp. NPDC048911 TaxID=3364527 RepID=UPI003715326B